MIRIRPHYPDLDSLFVGRRSLIMLNPALLTIICYFLLSLMITVTNKQIVLETSCPYLLTASHSFCTLITTHLIASFSHHTDVGREKGAIVASSTAFTNFSLRAHIILVCFSLLYTINIAISNLSLGLVSLSLHQTIRATAPAITVLLSITLLNRSFRSYSSSTYLSLIPIIAGVIIATKSPSTGNAASREPATSSLNGILLTFLGAVLAVLKTILTNTLQQPEPSAHTGRSASTMNLSLNLTPTALIRYTSTYAVGQALGLATWAGEFPRLVQIITDSTSPSTTAAATAASVNSRILTLTVANVLTAAMLNIASFEANRHCGPLAMSVVANLKQVVVLMFGRRDGADGGWVVVGALMTVVGGAWFAGAQRKGGKGEGGEEE